MEKNILIICEAGVSAALFVSKMVEESRAQKLDFNIDYAPMNRVDYRLNKEKYDVLILTPQITRYRDRVEEIIKEQKCQAQLIKMSEEDFRAVNVVHLLSLIK